MTDTKFPADTWRNRIAAKMCNWILIHIADDTYEKAINGAVMYGLKAAARDHLDGREAP